MRTVRLPEEIEKRLDHLAVETHRSKSYYIRQAIEAYLEDQEEYLLAQAVQMRIRSGLEKTHSLAEVEETLKRGND